MCESLYFTQHFALLICKVKSRLQVLIWESLPSQCDEVLLCVSEVITLCWSLSGVEEH